LLRPGGVLVAVCLNGPRQQEKLLPFSDVREETSNKAVSRS
ncbi:class I SAM-dependent methyltransferase, partial [Escherichia coli]